MRHKILLLFTLILVFGCGRKSCETDPDIAKIKVDLEIERLEQPFFKLQTPAQVKTFLDQQPLFADHFLTRKRYPSDDILVNQAHKLATDPNIDKLVSETNQAFKDISDIEEGLENAFRHLKYYYPDQPVPEVKTFITGLGQDLYADDSLIVLGLDFFIGKKATYKPDFPNYIRKRYDRPYIVPSTVLLLSDKFNKTDFLNKTMLAEMIYFGKSYYFVKSMLPCTPDSLIIGYSGQDLANSEFNEGKIWAHFVEKGLLYETNRMTINKYIGERPNIPEISKICPGRIGGWVGWQIVKKYMDEHPDVTLQELMTMTDPQKILVESKYKPKRKK